MRYNKEAAKVGETMLGRKPGSTREEILYLLKTHGPLSAGDIAEKLGISEMAVRRHLSTLERDNLVRTTRVRQTMGRPAHLFGLTEKADALFPKHYADFALELLKDLVAEDGTEKMEELLARREERLRERYQPHMAGKTLRERVATLAALQNEKGYMADWNAEGDRRFVLTERNCPIVRVAQEFLQVCQCELRLFRALLAADVKQVQCIAQGGQHCVYVIQERA